MAFEKICINGLEIIRISELKPYGVEAFFTTRRYLGSDDFNLSYKWARSKEEIDNNFLVLFKNLGVDHRNIYYAKQVHKNDIIVVEKGFDFFAYNQEIEADGLITLKSDITLMTFHADCIPVYIFDQEKRIISLLHSGWRGTLQHITKKALEVLNFKFGCNISNLIVAIGPGICKNHFEVGKDVYDAFLKEFSGDICMSNKERFYVDLKKSIERDLLESGVKKEQIIISEMCTYENEDLFFSYRRDFRTPEKLGSMVAIMRMVR
ncbi:peptidoglycan editing factor PgeF [Caldicellulosiruptor naganoensis]|uniref:Purine nucleoside phosphorylase n=1 Tax=Caldicellulosiruptor naganoensis TaxID=29324 RepID=A0ABY7BDH1_9FIRM|nr:peptidoglycan editing factor PgeF [Caldicellulosiruptor naganoensis]WAM30485.1 peptidoglycan editing factor PgeF [Caldicellulosiruptor naganoensis]